MCNLPDDIIDCSFSLIVESIIAFAKEVGTDRKVLSQLNMHHTNVSYEISNGVAELFCGKLVQNLPSTPFSPNLDEATSSNQLYVLTVLSSHNKEQNLIAVEHLASVDVLSIDVVSLFEEMKGIFEKHDLPWGNLSVIFMGNARLLLMCGEKSGLEVHIPELYPYLLNIEGSSCHHITICTI